MTTSACHATPPRLQHGVAVCEDKHPMAWHGTTCHVMTSPLACSTALQ